jgi:hypothetical protein
MAAAAPYATHARATEGEDPVLAAIRRARLCPLPSEDERVRLLALDAEAKSDPRTWQGTDAFMAKLAKLAESADEHEDADE